VSFTVKGLIRLAIYNISAYNVASLHSFNPQYKTDIMIVPNILF